MSNPYESDIQRYISESSLVAYACFLEQLTKDCFRPKWENKVRLNLAGIQWLDCVPKEAGKGTAVAFLQGHLQITPEETCVFGDNENDIVHDAAGKIQFCRGKCERRSETCRIP